MAQLFRRTYKKTDPATGRVVEREMKKWYGKYKNEHGVWQRVPLSTNKAAAQQGLNELVARAERRKSSVYHPAEEHAGRPLAEHLNDYRAEQLAREVPAEQVTQTDTRVRAVLEGCKFDYPASVNATAVLQYLADLRRERPAPDLPPNRERFTPAELAQLLGVGRPAVTSMIRRQGLSQTAQGQGRSRTYPRATAEALIELSCRGLGSQTTSAYWREFKAFCRWLSSGRQKRMVENPLNGVTGPDPRSDPRHDRRPLSEEELRRFLSAARTSARTWRGLTGNDRWHLYLLAYVTGYRRKELSSLTPDHFDLDDNPSVVSLPGKRTKNKRAACQPLPADVAAAMREYVANRAPDAILWAKGQLREIVAVLRYDLEAVGIPYAVEGPDGTLYADFHSLRPSYVLMLDQSGGTLKEAMQLARHSDPKLTMARYGRAQLHDLGAAVERLPALTGGDVPRSDSEATTLRATGTDGNFPPAESALAQGLARTSASGCERMKTGDDLGGSPRPDSNPCLTQHLHTAESDRDDMLANDTAPVNEETPGDRLRAFLGWGRVGASMKRNSPGPWNGYGRRSSQDGLRGRDRLPQTVCGVFRRPAATRRTRPGELRG